MAFRYYCTATSFTTIDLKDPLKIPVVLNLFKLSSNDVGWWVVLLFVLTKWVTVTEMFLKYVYLHYTYTTLLSNDAVKSIYMFLTYRT